MHIPHIARNLRPRFVTRTIYWIEDRNGAVMFKDGQTHSERAHQSRPDQDEDESLQGLQMIPVRMRFQAEAFTTTDKQTAMDKLAAFRKQSRDPLAVLGSCKMWFPTKQREPKAQKCRHAKHLDRMANAAFDLTQYHHKQRMARQQAHKQ